MQTQRARESFRRTWKRQRSIGRASATTTSDDSSKSWELDAARERFERAIQIDEEEIDAHYQLGVLRDSRNALPTPFST